MKVFDWDGTLVEASKGMYTFFLCNARFHRSVQKSIKKSRKNAERIFIWLRGGLAPTYSDDITSSYADVA